MYISDKRRIEMAVLPCLFYKIVSSIIEENEEVDEKYLQAQLLLKKACYEPFIGAANEIKLQRRIRKDIDTAVFKHYIGVHSFHIFLMFYYYLIALTDSEKILLVQGSSFDKAQEILFDLVLNNKNMVEKYDSEAFLGSKDLAKKIEHLGYFN